MRNRRGIDELTAVTPLILAMSMLGPMGAGQLRQAPAMSLPPKRSGDIEIIAKAEAKRRRKLERNLALNRR